VHHYKCTSKAQLEDDLKKMIKLGGEGLMIRQPGSQYERCRSKTLLKLKKFYDAEVCSLFIFGTLNILF
jgi:DNA ligase-1